MAFGPPGPPEGTLLLAWDITEIGPSVQPAAAVAIDFQFRIVETASPPAGVTGVPVRVAATGSASARGATSPVANSVFRFHVIGAGVLITDRVDVDDNSSTENPASDAFTIDETTEIPLDAITLVSMSTAASAGLMASGEARTGSTTGMIDPVIEIVDDPIPGSSGSYRDCFSIEFSEGYDAQTTPVKRITRGELKRLYREHR